MDFFAAQELARRKTKWLIFYYALAILCMTIGIYVVVLFAFGLASKGENNAQFSIFQPIVFVVVALLNMLVIGFGSMSKTMELRGGGHQVASLMGGSRIPPSTTDLQERKLLNVVEEMALASGISVPPVYVMQHEPGINAFAAGYSPSDAVIGVNRGTIEQLNRDELQGVIAHEFSHILNGDMRMNIRLIGLLYGIQMLAMIGYFVMRAAGVGGRSSDRDNKGQAAFLLVGLGILVFGSIGQFFARLIKASISRQREYLADASAVQFTRYPAGIGGALKMIGASSYGSKIQSREAESMSHMFFASCFTTHFASLFATHPPLMDRIKKLDPNFDGNLESYLAERDRLAKARQKQERPAKDKRQQAASMTGFPIFAAEIAARFSIDPMFLVAAIGAPTQADVNYSQDLIKQIPQQLILAARDVFSARCIAFATLLDGAETMRGHQMELIAKFEGAASAEHTAQLWPIVRSLDLALRLPIMEMIQGSLCDLSPQQYARFRGTVEALVKIDHRISLFEFVVRHHLLMHLDRRFSGRRPAAAHYREVGQLHEEIELLLSAFASVGEMDYTTCLAAYRLALQTVGFGEADASQAEPRVWQMGQLESSLQKLEISTMEVKKAFLQAVAVLITYDHEINVAEAELFRAFAEALDCPVPAFVAGKTKAIQRDITN